MVLVAGCGGNSNGDEATTSSGGTGPNEASTGTQVADPATNEPGGASGTAVTEATGTPSGATTDAGLSTAPSNLSVRVEPAVVNETNAALVVHLPVTEASATDGIENITVNTGDGLDLTNVSTANVSTAGVDENGTLPGNETDGYLSAHVESGIEVDDNGKSFVVPMDGNRSIAAGDELVLVIDDGVKTDASGTHTFSIAINDAPPQTTTYNISQSRA